jgi:hypothetical protein
MIVTNLELFSLFSFPSHQLLQHPSIQLLNVSYINAELCMRNTIASIGCRVSHSNLTSSML